MKKFEKLKIVRKKNNMTQKILANKLHINKQYLWDIENGKKPLNYKMAFMISKILDTTPDELFLEDYKKNNDKYN